ncbi:glycoside hydrolase family 76 protein [Arthrobacter agilis]|uniref:glycoside hydrolase family 76 protein n=1 Tax=Arthrobacter agilis TaxID=37921 RepID=UPI0023657A1D|nr:glycoside hydrolase family 76 protein [Arthrobacter agilis]WDF33698.1 glycoside hydrolase family 76 protein [Arthrobacter agilis]
MPIPHAAAPTAAATVRRLYARRSLHMPGTRLGAIAFPPPTSAHSHWHYWWQAHLLDCLLDEHRRAPTGDALDEARRLARGIWLRNGARWRNAYYDDMAWLVLALQRLDAVDGRRRPRRRVRVLGDALRSAHTPDLGGGVYWNTARDFKNTPSTAPAALFFARAGDTPRAQELLDWLRGRLFDTERGLYLDGVKADGRVQRAVYTYNQGTVLGALVAVGGTRNLAHAAALVEAIAREVAGDDGVLPLAADGDGGLFTGILARYLAEAAVADVGHTAATAARRMLDATAAHVWDSRRSTGGELTFPPPQDGPVSLSSQLQAWMVLEAHAAVHGPAT